MYDQHDSYKNQNAHQQQQQQQPYAQPYGQPYAQPYAQPYGQAAQPSAYAYGNGPPPAQPLYPPTQQPYGDSSAAHVQSVDSIKPEQSPATGCRDWPFAVVFVLNVATIIGLMAAWGIESTTDDETDSTSTSSSSNVLSADDTKKVIGIALGMSVVSVVLALVLVKLITAYARFMINFVLWFNVGVSVAVAAYGFAIGNLFLGILGAVIALLNFCYARLVQHRIPFAVANLRVAESAISKHKSTYAVSIVFTLVQIAWVVVWSLALLGVVNNLNTDETTTGRLANGQYCTASSQCESNSCKIYGGTRQCVSSVGKIFKGSPETYVAYFFLLISFYWGLQVFKNVAHTTVAGTVATFWYNSESAGATGSSLKRATTTSFGSICFGSLLVAILQALRALAESSREEGSFMGCICECILGCLQSLMEYFNRWAFVYVGIYGYKFTQAGKAVFQLFNQRGWDAIINDDLIGNVLSFAALGIGLVCAGIGGAIGEATDVVTFENTTLFLAVLGFIVGAGVAITPLAVIDSSVATVFVCFAEDPAAFMQSHPDLYHPLVTEWHNLYPEIMVQSGYWHVPLMRQWDAQQQIFRAISSTLLSILSFSAFVVAEDRAGEDDTESEHRSAVVILEIFRYLFIVLLVGMSAIFSGLTLGLLSLDKVGLEVIIGAGEREGASDEEQAKAEAAKKTLPVRENGNMLLTTLVLGNVSVNSLLSILMADLTSGFVGFLLSTILIVICGEIIPQAFCSRHALSTGSRLVPLVKVLLCIFYPASKCMGMALDYALGEDVGTIFSKRELQKLLEIHVKQQTLHPEEGHIVRGAMGYKQKVVGQIMIPFENIYSLPISSFFSLPRVLNRQCLAFWINHASTKLSMDTIKKVYSSGFSRIPVWGKDVNDVIGIIFVKDLVYIDPKENVPLHEFVQVFARAAHRVWADSKLGEILTVFKQGVIHMALVYDVNNTGPGDPFYELKGMVTLEDVVEEILQSKIVDDTASHEARRVRKSCADRITLDYGGEDIAVWLWRMSWQHELAF